jgi:hypothetical protein
MATITLTLQNVNGDPFTSGGNINITTGTTSGGLFVEPGTVSLSSVEAGDTIEIGGLVYNYDYLGSHLVRNDPDQPAAYIRIVGPLPAGATLTVGTTYAIDLSGQPGDPDYPDLQNGNTKAGVADLDTTTPVQFPGYICFAKGTLINTPGGPVAVEDLMEGDLVNTEDNGAQEVRWIGHRRLWADEAHAPIVINAGVLKNSKPLTVSPCHRLLLSGWQVQMTMGTDQTLVAAKQLLHLDGVRRSPAGWVDYFHVLLDRHEIIFANGQPAESFHCNINNLQLIDPEGRNEILSIFPELSNPDTIPQPTVRSCAKRFEAELLHR